MCEYIQIYPHINTYILYIFTIRTVHTLHELRAVYEQETRHACIHACMHAAHPCMSTHTRRDIYMHYMQASNQQ